MPFQFENYGRYISVDGNWLITRAVHPRTKTRTWQVSRWNEEVREFVPVDGANFISLAMAKFYVTDLGDFVTLF